MQQLEYDKMKDELRHYAMSYLGKAHVAALAPIDHLPKISQQLAEVEEALAIVNTGSSVPIPSLEGIEMGMSHLGKGFLMSERELADMARFIDSTQQLKRYMAKKESIAPRVAAYVWALHDLEPLLAELNRCIQHGQLADHASDTLAKLRKRAGVIEERVKKKLDSTLQKYRSYLQEHIVTMRGGRYVLAVKRDHKRSVKGALIDESASGQTVFIEPADILPLQEELEACRAEEDLEKTRVLSRLTGLVEADAEALTANLELVGHYDFLFAKAKYAKVLDGRSVRLNDVGRIVIRGGRHPLLEGKRVPLDFAIGPTAGYRALLITGPNTGGKTVSLKTVGLLSLMVQSGLLVPVEADSEFAVFRDVFVDIGDGQSIEHALSTFSAHVKSVIEILEAAGPNTLILLDELASGTDPGEGIGLSIAVLEELYRRGATIVATTHFNEIKQFAKRSAGFENARMEFDIETLEPQYRLRIGEAGRSYAFEIALKLGVAPEIIARSREIAGDQRNASVQMEGTPEARGAQTSVDSSQPEQKTSESTAAQSGLVRERIRKRLPSEGPQKSEASDVAFQIGDRVWVHPLKQSGIVYRLPDARGKLGVIVKKEKLTINVKRISPYLSREELYPENYDLAIVLESKEVRKKRNIMRRKHAEGLTIEHPTDEPKDIR
jgi:dsDNA-specific endonuclease/ATPase MutS2